MFRVEKMKVGDFQFAVQLANTMDWNMALEDFEFVTKLEPKGCFVLFHGSERLGIITCISFGRVGWLGNLIVKEEYKQRGAGTFLVKHAIKYLKSKGAETTGLYAYPHLIGFYENFGFKPDIDFLVLQGKPTSTATEGMPREATKQDVPVLIDFDCQCFGANRKKLLEPLFLCGRSLCYIVTGDDEIIGYGAAKVYDQMVEVGPLLCRQNRVDVAVALLKAVLGKLRNRDVFICPPAEETDILEVLSKAGFREKFRVTRMFLGPAVAKNCTYIAESLERG